MNELFYELIRVSIGTQDSLSHMPSAREWSKLYKKAEKQSLVGVCFVGLQRLGADADDGFSRIGMSEMQYLNWMGMAAQIQKRNEEMDEYTGDALAHFRKEGFACQVLKGQGIAKLYGSLSGLRQSGDVDVWLNASRKDLYALSQKEFCKVEGITYHHIHYPIFDNCEVEAHLWPSFLSSPRRNKVLKEFCIIHRPFNGCSDVPSLDFNRVFVLLHCYRHFCGHGIGLRQWLDYYYVLTQGFTEEEKLNSLTWIERLGMLKFCKAAMWLLHYVFGLENSKMLCAPDEYNGRFLLEEVIQSGNFGHGDGRNKISGSALCRYLYNIKRDIRTIKICPHESIWDPVFNIYQFAMSHFLWKRKR